MEIIISKVKSFHPPLTHLSPVSISKINFISDGGLTPGGEVCVNK